MCVWSLLFNQMTTMEKLFNSYDVVIIGAGIVGLTTAYALHKARPDVTIAVIEKSDKPGTHQTGHNSGVIHAGIYYAPGSLKARLCAEGSMATRLFCEEHEIAYNVCGKLIVATSDDELLRMQALKDRACANGLDIRQVSQGELVEIEPSIRGVGALMSPTSGIVNYADICYALHERLANDGVSFHFDSAVTQLDERSDSITVESDQGICRASQLIACAGLQADRIAALSELSDDFRIIPFRGEYYRVADTALTDVNHLIYPVPEPSLPFLGVHLTPMIGGYKTVGPSAMVSLGRETYESNRPHLRDMMTSARFPGFWKLMMRNARAGVHELHGSLSKSIYLRRCQKYCPDLTAEDLQPHPPGIRAQAVDARGNMIDDFLLRETPRTIHVCNAPSPAATSAFPIGEEIAVRSLAKLTNHKQHPVGGSRV